MRDPARIPELLTLLAEYWEQHPDFRLGQIIVNLSPNGHPFHVEDDHLIAHLKELIARDRSFL